MSDPEATRAAIRRAFGETVDPVGHVSRAATDAALESLLDWARATGPGSTIAALVAPPGLGKTHLLRVLESRLADAPGGAQTSGRRRVLYLPYAALSLPDLCRWVHGLLGRELAEVPPSSDASAIGSLFGLAGGAEEPFHLLIDDADSMPVGTLRGLAQALPAERSPLRLVLALTDDSRATRMLAALDRLGPFELAYRSALDERETEAYLRARLEREGLGTELLDGLDAVTVARIRALSGGVPRRIHRVVNALLEPERSALARALAVHPRTDAWLGRPLDEPA